jgi:hypothetical protein
MISPPVAPPPGFEIGSRVVDRKSVENVNWPPLLGGPALPEVVAVDPPAEVVGVELACFDELQAEQMRASTATTNKPFLTLRRFRAAITSPSTLCRASCR